MGHGKGLCDYIGIYNGGFCGVWDFYTNREEVFIVYSIINTVVIVCAIKNIGILNREIAFGMFISWMIYIFSCIIFTPLIMAIKE